MSSLDWVMLIGAAVCGSWAIFLLYQGIHGTRKNRARPIERMSDIAQSAIYLFFPLFVISCFIGRQWLGVWQGFFRNESAIYVLWAVALIAFIPVTLFLYLGLAPYNASKPWFPMPGWLRRLAAQQLVAERAEQEGRRA
jgi:hypothetical protein